MSEIIHSGGSFGSWLGNLGRTPLKNIARYPLSRDNLPVLVSKSISNAISNFERKISGKGAVGAQKGFTLLTSNKDMNDFIKIIKSLEDSCLFIDEVTETVKLEIRRQEDGFLEALLPPLAVSLAQPVFFSVVKDKSRRGVRRSGYIDEKRIYR